MPLPEMHFHFEAIAAVLLVAWVSLAAILAAGSPARRKAALLTAAVATLVPWLASQDIPALRGLLALEAIWCLARVIDLVRDPYERSVWQRLWHVFGLLDTRQTRRASPALDLAAFGKTIAYAIPALAVLFTAVYITPLTDGAAYWALRWVGGVIFFYCLADVAEGLVRALYRAVGIIVPQLHWVPIASHSLQEFWGQRWNRVVSAWLYVHCFLPLARRGHASAGIMAAFLASSVLHAYFTLVAVGATMAAAMLAFFLIQGMLVLFEVNTEVSHWKPVLARAWTALAILGASPLFVEPLLRILHFAPKG